jgi:hypothetical protein
LLIAYSFFYHHRNNIVDLYETVNVPDTVKVATLQLPDVPVELVPGVTAKVELLGTLTTTTPEPPLPAE